MDWAAAAWVRAAAVKAAAAMETVWDKVVVASAEVETVADWAEEDWAAGAWVRAAAVKAAAARGVETMVWGWLSATELERWWESTSGR